MSDPLADELRYGSIKEIEPNRYGLKLAQALGAAKWGLNSVELGFPPMTGTMGVGDLLMGHGPELAEDLSYGFSGSRGKGMTYKPDPRYLDLALTPAPYGIMGKGAKSLAAKLLVGEEGVMANEARRNFLKQSSALAAGTAASGTVPDVVKTFLKEVAPAAAVQGGKAGVSAAVSAALAGGTKFFKGGGFKDFVARLSDEADFQQLSKSEQGVWEHTMDDFVAHPKSKEILEEALEGLDPKKLDEDFLARMLTWDSNPRSKKIKGMREEVDPHEYFYSSSEILKDPKNLADYEQYLLTGELRKGANADLPRINVLDLPENSKFKRLVDHIKEISGKKRKEYSLIDEAELAAYKASPEGRFKAAFTKSKEYRDYADQLIASTESYRPLDSFETAFRKRYRPE